MTTLLDALADALSVSSAYEASSQVAPAAVLWPDPDRAWEAAIPLLQQAAPVLVLGDRLPGTSTGPALWIRAVLSGATDPALDLTAPHGPDPEHPWVIYLPGVGREELRDVQGVAPHLAPLVELQHRATWWVQSNQQPWTPVGFLRSPSGVGLDVAGDAETRQAVDDALEGLLREDVDALRARGQLDAARLHQLLVRDQDRQVLDWMDDPQVLRARLSDAEWRAFCSTCRGTLRLDPTKDTPVTAAGHLGRRTGAWDGVWQRFAESAEHHPRIPDLLDAARPQGTLFEAPDDPHADSWPSAVAEAEDDARTVLASLTGLGPQQARERVAALHTEHLGPARSLWARRGRAPVLQALDALAELVPATARLPHATDSAALADWYAREGHLADDLALRALCEAPAARDRSAVLSALAAVHDSWVDDLAHRFQTAAVTDYRGVTGLDVEAGTCVVFVDALRYDLGARLAEVLDDDGRQVLLTHRLGAFPTVTPTGQPAVAPLASAPVGGPGFAAGDARGRAVSGPVLRAALAEAGVVFLDAASTGDPEGLAWTQSSDIDALGHGHGHKLADLLDRELGTIADRVGALLDAGWTRCVVVTDHGWLLPARPAQKVHLPLHLTEDERSRKPRVARLKAGQESGFPSLPWTWDPGVTMVSAPGAAAFEAGTLYEHGGLSLQECVLPVLTVTAGGASATAVARIDAVRWSGLRCRVDVSPTGLDGRVQVRSSPGDATSALTGLKPLADGEAKVLVRDDSHLGSAAHVVLLDPAGRVLAQHRTTVGENP